MDISTSGFLQLFHLWRRFLSTEFNKSSLAPEVSLRPKVQPFPLLQLLPRALNYIAAEPNLAFLYTTGKWRLQAQKYSSTSTCEDKSYIFRFTDLCHGATPRQSSQVSINDTIEITPVDFPRACVNRPWCGTVELQNRRRRARSDALDNIYRIFSNLHVIRTVFTVSEG